MRVLPVIDLKQGQVVHAIAGRRDEYRPIRSSLVATSSPRIVAEAFRDQFDMKEIYVADIDALSGRPGNDAAIQDILALNLRVWLDCGIRGADDLQALAFRLEDFQRKVTRILASESIRGTEALKTVYDAGVRAGVECAFSLDLRQQQVMSSDAWDHASAEEIVAMAVDIGLKRIIVLDLAQVGSRAGTGTLELIHRLRRQHLNIELFPGGGVRSIDDLRALRDAGCHGALVATALHEGRITREDLETM